MQQQCQKPRTVKAMSSDARRSLWAHESDVQGLDFNDGGGSGAVAVPNGRRRLLRSSGDALSIFFWSAAYMFGYPN